MVIILILKRVFRIYGKAITVSRFYAFSFVFNFNIFFIKEKELQEAYKKVAPNPENLITMHNKDRGRMVNFKDWPDAFLQSIKAPALIIIGDKDVMLPEHAVAMSRLIPNCRLAILPCGHGEYIGEITYKLPSTLPALTVKMVEDFLNE